MLLIIGNYFKLSIGHICCGDNSSPYMIDLLQSSFFLARLLLASGWVSFPVYEMMHGQDGGCCGHLAI